MWINALAAWLWLNFLIFTAKWENSCKMWSCFTAKWKRLKPFVQNVELRQAAAQGGAGTSPQWRHGYSHRLHPLFQSGVGTCRFLPYFTVLDDCKPSTNTLPPLYPHHFTPAALPLPLAALPAPLYPRLPSLYLRLSPLYPRLPSLYLLLLPFSLNLSGSEWNFLPFSALHVWTLVRFSQLWDCPVLFFLLNPSFENFL